MQPIIETERLYIRELTLADDKGMFEMDSDPLVHRFVGNNPLTTIKQCRDVIEYVRGQYKEFGIGRWAIIEKGTDEFVGWTGHKFMKGPVNGHSGFYDFGYRLARRFWGKGYATESGHASLHYGIDTLKFKDIYAMTDVNNTASRKILEKLGFKFIEIFSYDSEPGWRNEGEPATWYKWIAPQKEI